MALHRPSLSVTHFTDVDRDLFHASSQIVPQEYFKPLKLIFKQIKQISSAVNNNTLQGTANISSDYENFQVFLDVQHFAQKDIRVNVRDRIIIVEGKHEEKRDEQGFVSRHFVRKYPLPEGCLSDTVKCALSSDGILIVTALKVVPMPSVGERIVPIIKTGPFPQYIK